jgi:hypothetical protein
MNLSLGEFRALTAKALRGVGYSWGLTEDGAFAASRLAEAGLPAGDVLLRLLQHVDGRAVSSLMPDEAWRARVNSLCPICVGSAATDLGSVPIDTIGPTAEPLLLIPFLQVVSGSDVTQVTTLEWSGGRSVITPTSLTVQGDLPAGTHPLTIGVTGPGESNAVERRSRVDLSEETRAGLEAFAHRTYAPATEASRDGAGAGTSDND